MFFLETLRLEQSTRLSFSTGYSNLKPVTFSESSLFMFVLIRGSSTRGAISMSRENVETANWNGKVFLVLISYSYSNLNPRLLYLIRDH